MKFLPLLLLMTCLSYSQTITEKYNTMLSRYEYYNSYGDLIGYKIYNDIRQVWEYYDNKPEPTYPSSQSSINLPLLQQTMQSKQNKFDANVSRVRDCLSKLGDGVDNLEISSTTKRTIKDRFNNDYVNKLNNSKYDYSSNSLTEKIIDWLIEGMRSILNQELKN